MRCSRLCPAHCQARRYKTKSGLHITGKLTACKHEAGVGYLQLLAGVMPADTPAGCAPGDLK